MGHGAGAVARIPHGFVVGAKAVRRAADEARPVRRVIVAADAPPGTVEPVRRLAADHHWTVVEVPSSAALGRYCGITRPVAAAAQLEDA